MKRLFGTTIPTNLKELQGLLGRLNYVSGLIPQFKTRVKPIERLLRASSDAHWTEECTAALNDLFQAAASHLHLELYHPGRPIQVHYSKGEGDCEVVLAQKTEAGDMRPFFLAGRKITPTELNKLT